MNHRISEVSAPRGLIVPRAIFLLLSITPQVLADAPSEVDLSVGYADALVRTAIFLATIAALGWLVVRWGPRWLARRGRGIDESRQLEVLEQMVLEPRRRLHLVRVGAEVRCLVTSEAGVTDLGPVTEQVLRAPSTEGPPTTGVDLASRLSTLLKPPAAGAREPSGGLRHG